MGCSQGLNKEEGNGFAHTSTVVSHRRRRFFQGDTRRFESLHTMHFEPIQHHDLEHKKIRGGMDNKSARECRDIEDLGLCPSAPEMRKGELTSFSAGRSR